MQTSVVNVCLDSAQRFKLDLSVWFGWSNHDYVNNFIKSIKSKILYKSVVILSLVWPQFRNVRF